MGERDVFDDWNSSPLTREARREAAEAGKAAARCIIAKIRKARKAADKKLKRKATP